MALILCLYALIGCDSENNQVPNCIVGATCDDGDPATANDIYDADCNCIGEIANTFSDPRDGKVYATVTIGSKTWFAENLDFESGNSWCYDNNSINCDKYGRLYDWQTAQGVCPVGWHLPTDAEWTALTNSLGGEAVAGGKMKEAGTLNWMDPNTGATNESGFTGLPGGYRTFNGLYGNSMSNGYWWTATEINASSAWNRLLGFDYAIIYRYNLDKANGFSVRCVKD